MINLLEHLLETSYDATDIKKFTNTDPVLSTVRRCILSGSTVPEEEDFKPYKTRQHELSVLQGCLLCGSRVVIPKKCRATVFKELHEMHQGVNKMKSLARSYVWWPKMDYEIEEMLKKCQICQELHPTPPAAPLHPWEWPTQPWSRIHLDFAGPFI